MRRTGWIILAAALGGCSLTFDFDNPVEEQPADSIAGRIVQQQAGTGALVPVHPCRVAARHTPISVANGPDGRFRMPDIPPGVYELIVQCDADGQGHYGLKQRRPGVYLESGDAVNLGDVVVLRTGSVAGVVRRGADPVSAGVLVVLEENETGDETGLSAYTDDAGAYRIDFVPPGRYTVVASAPGELGQKLPVEVREQQATEEANVELEEASETGEVVGRALIWGVPGTSAHGGIRVTATSGTQSFTDQTASDGSYFFVGVPAGGISLRAELDLHVPATVPHLVVRPGEQRTAPEMYLLSEVLEDCDGDGIPDDEDPDDDNDGFLDAPAGSDAFPCDPTEWVDTDGDGQGDNADVDDDDDGLMDWRDECPLEYAMTASGCPGGDERPVEAEAEAEADADAPDADAEVEVEVEAEVEPENEVEIEAEPDADAETEPETAEPADCTCSGVSLCCDGCRPTNEGSMCDDLDACTEMDSCISGSCVGQQKDCDDTNVCTVDSCDPASGCANTPMADDMPCSGGFPNAASACQSGVCEFGACDAGYHDLNADPGDGCEYYCMPTGAETCNDQDDDCNGQIDEGLDGAPCGTDTGVCQAGTVSCVAGTVECVGEVPPTIDVCNDLDDDCDGLPDEDYDKQADPYHCGSCGNDCTQQYANAVGDCSGGACSMLGCLPGYIDQNASDADGCECTPIAEVCDGADNDCDGSMDEDFDFMTDVSNCGGCGNDCEVLVADATPACNAGMCVVQSCDPGYYDLNGDPLDGCEYSCTPSGPEICDGMDDDCDGLTDEGLTPPVCPLFLGVCAGLTPTCMGGSGWDCDYATYSGGTYEVDETSCDGFDNDCDGLTDEGCACGAGPRPCGTSAGACTEGTQDCLGTWGDVCAGATGPTVETCDDQDNDCDGQTDEGLGGDPCGATDEGECEFGYTQCIGGMTQCVGEVGPTVEVCDGLDNDCDTLVDEDVAGVGMPCGPAEGECTEGVTACVAGVIECVGGTQPTTEICDGLDNDCDTLADEDLDAGFACLAPGECGPGLVECAGAAGTRCSTAPGGSNDQSVAEIPDNAKDDDCDGEVDEP